MPRAGEERWRPAATTATLGARAAMYAEIRRFFAERAVLEVETPVLSAAGNPEPNIESLRLDTTPPLYLHTSPEFAMKRLLAAGSGPVYQLCRVFRAGERSREHSPEFTMLEWYRTGLDLPAMMEETLELVGRCLERRLPEPRRLTWRDAFRQCLDLDPDEATTEALRACARSGGLAVGELNREQWLDLVFGERVARAFPEDTPVLITEFPAIQAALARADTCARRFELFLGGLELANGYEELTDPAELRGRFEAWNRRRAEERRSPVPVDEHLLAAMESGLPECCGVALGVDRLLMLRTGASGIDEVLSFPADRA